MLNEKVASSLPFQYTYSPDPHSHRKVLVLIRYHTFSGILFGELQL